MKFKHIHFIVNPASGKEEPVLSYINKVLDDSGINWELSITKKHISAADIARKLIGKTELIAVYGGDGCVTEVASALQGSGTPMAIIPGGTANVMAKELGIPQETLLALEVLKSNGAMLKLVDMGLMNGKPFLLRVNLGIMADMVLQADRELKDEIGQLAYGITALKTINNAEPVKYRLEIDGEVFEEQAVSITVTNSGNMGIGDFALQPGISITDGLLDVILLRDNSFMSLMKAAGSALLQNKTDAVQHWQCKKVAIDSLTEQKFICDDFEQQAKRIEIEVIPASINILVPPDKN
ncbi:diacylglycerol/lipid kinase family protein [Mucilaginibacter celer]|uniref:YegS/Rv2252/BmrU family lipid kinase n=1 Tax=Mucilaginibacter celer TaxID=2305508 RepID=A0A494VT34_9SPHI|nr:diacylglycerol kinase family protein [Mucilaginibacter celer]AYL96580.1 YegS/Rv2252/BmrU family lipid kinase [Mucilaginibacter celer]